MIYGQFLNGLVCLSDLEDAAETSRCVIGLGSVVIDEHRVVAAVAKKCAAK